MSKTSSECCLIILATFLNILDYSECILINGLDDHGYCGTVYNESADLLSSSGGRHLEPWSGIIFTRTGQGQPWSFIGEGALLSNSTILTKASIFNTKEKNKFEARPFEDYIVAFGVSSTEFPRKFDDFSSYSPVIFISIEDTDSVGGVSDSKLDTTLAIIHLGEEIIYGPFTNEICLPKKVVLMDSEDKIWIGGFTNPKINILDPKFLSSGGNSSRRIRDTSHLIVKDKDFCEKKYKMFTKETEMPSDLYCASPDYNRELMDWPKRCHKGTVVMYKDEISSQNFIVGVFVKYFEVSRSSDIAICTNQSVYFFISLEKHQEWILQNIRCGPWRFICSLENQCQNKPLCSQKCPTGQLRCGNGISSQCTSYEVLCNKQKDCEGVYKIGDGICKRNNEQPFPSLLIQSQNLTMELPSETGSKLCSPLKLPKDTKLTCIYPSHSNVKRPRNCTTLEKGLPLGTKVIVQCEKFYISKEDFSTLEINCMGNGEWTPRLKDFNCKLDCGRMDGPIEPLITHGWETTAFSYPWHGMLFSITQDGVDYNCGVTLISRSVVLSAAHCISREQFRGTATLLDTNSLEVVLGSSLSDIDNSSLPIQRFKVKEMSIPDNFNPRSFEGDIALIRLDGDVKLTETIRPVCFPFPGERSSSLELYQLTPGALGHVAGFGIEENGELPGNLRSLSMPYISHADCTAALDRHILPSQFCAGYKNGSGTCVGDSGGGLIFSQGTGVPQRYFIQGVVSNSQPLKGTNKCNHNNYSVFTKVSSFAQWIQKQLNIFESQLN